MLGENTASNFLRSHFSESDVFFCIGVLVSNPIGKDKGSSKKFIHCFPELSNNLSLILIKDVNDMILITINFTRICRYLDDITEINTNI